MIIKCPDDRVAGLVVLAPGPDPHLGIGLGQHPVHVQNFDASVHATRGAQLAVMAEGAAATVALVARHVGRLVGGRLRGVARHLCLVLQIEPRAQQALGAIARAVLRSRFLL